MSHSQTYHLSKQPNWDQKLNLDSVIATEKKHKFEKSKHSMPKKKTLKRNCQSCKGLFRKNEESFIDDISLHANSTRGCYVNNFEKTQINPNFHRFVPHSSKNIPIRISSVIPNAPISPSTALKEYSSFLNFYELTEISAFNEIFFLGLPSHKSTPVLTDSRNYNFDDEQCNYRIFPGDHIAYRYQIISLLTNGSGKNSVYAHCIDHKKGESIALKIYKNGITSSMVLNEIQILATLASCKDSYISRAFDIFRFRGHLCISFELLGKSVDELNTIFQPHDIIRIAHNILSALSTLHRIGYIHNNVNPKNILMFNKGFKLIHFGDSIVSPLSLSNNSLGSSPFLIDKNNLHASESQPPHFFINKQVFPIQSPKLTKNHNSNSYIDKCFSSSEVIQSFDITHENFQYTAPEVLQKIHIGMENDIWSLGVVLAEGLSGKQLFSSNKIDEVIAEQDRFTLSIERDQNFICSFLNTDDQNIGELISLCLTKEHSKRPTADQLLQLPIFQQPNLFS